MLLSLLAEVDDSGTGWMPSRWQGVFLVVMPLQRGRLFRDTDEEEVGVLVFAMVQFP